MPDVMPRDRVFAEHPDRGPIAVRVTAVGKDGFRGVCDQGEKHGIPWASYLGHQARASDRFDVVAQGTDGALVRDSTGKTRFLAGELPVPGSAPAAAKPGAGKKDDPLLGGLDQLAKAFETMPVRRIPEGTRLLLKAGVPIKNRPGLQLKELTDKLGHQTHRWESSGQPDAGGAKAPMKHGDMVGFKHGDVHGQGRIIGSGADGVTVQDAQGREHKVRHEHLTGPTENAAAAYPPREPGEDDKAYLKKHAANLPNPKLKEDHGAYFNMGGAKTRTLPMDQLVGTKSDEENAKGGNNSPKFMAAAAAGVVAKRDPVTVKKRPDGKYDVVDGNGTFIGAKAHGWQTLPVQVHDDAEQGAAAQGDPDGAGKPLFEPGEVEKLPAKAVQPIKDKTELFKASAEGLEQLREWLNRGKGVASQAGAQTMAKAPEDVTPEEWDKPGPMLFIAPLKSEKRSAEKVEADYGGDWSQLKDTVRGSLAVDSIDDLHGMVDKLKAGGLKLAQQPKDRFAKPTGSGYRDMLLNITLPNGLVGELQLHVKPMLKAKNEGHHHYETERTLDAKMKGGATLSTQEQSALKEAQEKQRQIYQAAWEAATRVPGGTGGTMTKAMAADTGFSYFEHDGAFFRRKNNGTTRSVDEVLHGKDWKPYSGDQLEPALFGDEVADPLAGAGGQGGEMMAKADGGPRLLLLKPAAQAPVADAPSEAPSALAPVASRGLMKSILTFFRPARRR